jgi:GT2 family glycosyltransferase
MSVGVIIVNYFTEELLRPLVHQVAGFPMVRQVVVFDNGGAAPLTFGEGPVRVMGEGRNLGFAAAVNRAFAALSTEQVLLLNPDIRLDDRCLARLIAAGERHDCPIVGPRFYWDDNRLFRLPPATGALTWLGADDHHALAGYLRGHYWAVHHDHYWAQGSPFRQPFLPGACLLLASDWLRARGRVFDERYFMYYEDTDLCIEAQCEGRTPLCVPGAEAVHYWDQSPDPEGGKARLMAAAGRALNAKFALSGRGQPDPPPQQPRVPTRPVMDLGLNIEPPRFALPAHGGGCHFEIAVEPGFVPFAQAMLGPMGIVAASGPWVGRVRPWWAGLARGAGAVKTWQFPASIWSRLRPGSYYARLRRADGGSECQWRWIRGA